MIPEITDALVYALSILQFCLGSWSLLTSANLDLTKDRLALKRGKAVLNKTSMLSYMEYTSIIQ